MFANEGYPIILGVDCFAVVRKDTSEIVKLLSTLALADRYDLANPDYDIRMVRVVLPKNI